MLTSVKKLPTWDVKSRYFQCFGGHPKFFDFEILNEKTPGLRSLKKLPTWDVKSRYFQCFGGHPNFFDFKFQVNKSCSQCNEDFVREPGFYYGAMFLSYIISAFFSLSICGICIIVLGIEWKMSIFILCCILALLFVFLFRFSRSLWIHIMVKPKIK